MPLASAPPFPEEAYRLLPKAELHLHLEGTVGPAAILALCGRWGVAPPAPDEEGIRQWLAYGCFDDFLDRYLFACRLLRDAADFERIAHDYLLEAHRQGVVHVDFHVSASVHCLVSHLPWEVVLAGADRGCRSAEREVGITASLVPDVVAKFGLLECRRLVESILARPHPRVRGLGIIGPAQSWKAEGFGELARRAREAGLAVVVHAGEHGGAWEVEHALDELAPTRIAHGIGAAQDEALLARLREGGIPCDVCIASNVELKAVPSAEEHPLPRMLAAGVPITLGSDDPPFVHSTLLDEYRLAWERLGLRHEALLEIARASLRHALAPDETRQRWLAELDRVAASAGIDGKVGAT